MDAVADSTSASPSRSRSATASWTGHARDVRDRPLRPGETGAVRVLPEAAGRRGGPGATTSTSPSRSRSAAAAIAASAPGMRVRAQEDALPPTFSYQKVVPTRKFAPGLQDVEVAVAVEVRRPPSRTWRRACVEIVWCDQERAVARAGSRDQAEAVAEERLGRGHVEVAVAVEVAGGDARLAAARQRDGRPGGAVPRRVLEQQRRAVVAGAQQVEVAVARDVRELDVRRAAERGADGALRPGAAVARGVREPGERAGARRRPDRRDVHVPVAVDVARGGDGGAREGGRDRCASSTRSRRPRCCRARARRPPRNAVQTASRSPSPSTSAGTTRLRAARPPVAIVRGRKQAFWCSVSLRYQATVARRLHGERRRGPRPRRGRRPTAVTAPAWVGRTARGVQAAGVPCRCSRTRASALPVKRQHVQVAVGRRRRPRAAGAFRTAMAAIVGTRPLPGRSRTSPAPRAGAEHVEIAVAVEVGHRQAGVPVKRRVRGGQAVASPAVFSSQKCIGPGRRPHEVRVAVPVQVAGRDRGRASPSVAIV